MNKLNVFLLTAFSLAILSSGCKKDTVVVPKTQTELLTAHIWEVGQYVQDISGTIDSFSRGSSSNTISEDQIRFTFNANGTGTHINNVGTVYTMVWNFSNTSQTEMHTVFTNGGSSFSADWSLISLSDSSFNETTVLSNGLASTRLVPEP
jgi:hypothetical protein